MSASCKRNMSQLQKSLNCSVLSVKSVKYREYHVDADFMNHPILNNGVERMAVMRNRLDQVANPFVIGEEGYIRFTGLYRQLAEDNIAAGCIDYTKG